MHVLRVLLTTVILSSSLAAQADICHRTEAIKREIMRKLSKSDCKRVSSADLQSITWLDLSSKGLEGRLQGNDFTGLTSLQWLFLEDNQLTTLEGLSGLTSLQWLYLDNNHLTTLEGLFWARFLARARA